MENNYYLGEWLYYLWKNNIIYNNIKIQVLVRISTELVVQYSTSTYHVYKIYLQSRPNVSHGDN